MSTRNSRMNTHGGIFHNSTNADQPKASSPTYYRDKSLTVYRLANKQGMVYPYEGCYFSMKRNGVSADTCAFWLAFIVNLLQPGLLSQKPRLRNCLDQIGLCLCLRERDCVDNLMQEGGHSPLW